jgi:hypothetical protein
MEPPNVALVRETSDVEGSTSLNRHPPVLQTCDAGNDAGKARQLSAVSESAAIAAPFSNDRVRYFSNI